MQNSLSNKIQRIARITQDECASAVILELLETLRELRDEQNGIPLFSREQQYLEAIRKTDLILKKYRF